MQKIVYIDVDQTLTNSYWLVSFAKELIINKTGNKFYLDKIIKQFDRYQVSKDNIDSIKSDTYLYTSNQTTKNFINSIKNESVTKIKLLAQRHFKKQIVSSQFVYSHELISYFKKNNYKIVLISASPIELIELVKKYYQLDQAFGLTGEIVNDKYTGRILLNPGMPEIKADIVDKINHKFGSPVQTVAIGDSLGDQAMLDKANTAIVLNPDREMQKIIIIKKYHHIKTNIHTVDNIAKLLKRNKPEQSEHYPHLC